MPDTGVPLLAHSMLIGPGTVPSVIDQQDADVSWDLNRDLNRGSIIPGGAEDVLRPGTVIGLSQLRGRGQDDLFGDVGHVRS